MPRVRNGLKSSEKRLLLCMKMKYEQCFEIESEIVSFFSLKQKQRNFASSKLSGFLPIMADAEQRLVNCLAVLLERLSLCNNQLMP